MKIISEKYLEQFFEKFFWGTVAIVYGVSFWIIWKKIIPILKNYF